MAKLTLQSCMDALTQDVAHMCEDNQTAFAQMLVSLAKLYRDDATHKAVLVMSDGDMRTLLCMNADEYEAYGLLHDIVPFHNQLVTAQQPENLN